MLLDTILSKADEVLPCNTTSVLTSFVFGAFKVYHRDWLIYSYGTDRSGRCWYNFPIPNSLRQAAMVTVLIFGI